MGGKKEKSGCIGCFLYLIILSFIIYIVQAIVSFICKNWSEIVLLLLFLFCIVILVAKFKIQKTYKYKVHCDDEEEKENITRKILDIFKLKNANEEYHVEQDFDSPKSTGEMENQKEMDISEAYAEIDRANKLAEIANKTIERQEFCNAVVEIEKILTELSKYEDKFCFSYLLSANLRDLRFDRDKQIELLEKRITETKRKDVQPIANNQQSSEQRESLKMESTREMENIDNNLAKHGETYLTEILIRESKAERIKEEREISKEDNQLQKEVKLDNPIEELKEVNQTIGEEIPNPPEDKLIHEPFRYIFPPADLLNKVQGLETYENEIVQRKDRLKQTFEVFGVKADIVSISHGPRFTRFEIQIGKGVRIRDMLKIKDDIKLNLEAANIHIEAPIPGRTTIGIDVENKELSIVTIREMIESNEFVENLSDLAIAVGKDVVGNIIVKSLDDMCHLLIGGTTGSGKSVCISSIIMSILYKSSPESVKLIMIDTKAVNLTMYNGIPHLLIPVMTDLRKSTGALNWAIAEMMSRYDKFVKFGARDLERYNKVIEKYSSDDELLKKMPRIVIIIDDFSDLMIYGDNEAEEAICRIAQMGRAAGIHLVISTQRPSVDVVTGIIKANIPSRIAFNVFSAIDSRTILDAKGAEDLLPDGDMLFYPQWERMPLRVQGTFVSDKEIENVVDFLKNQMTEF